MKRHRFLLVLMLLASVLSFIGCQAPETQVTGTVNVTVDIQGYDGYEKAVVWAVDSAGNPGPESVTLLAEDKSGTLVLPAGSWTIQASVMKGESEIASGSTSVKVIPDTTVNASIVIKNENGGGGGGDDKPVEKGFTVTADRNEIVRRSAVRLTSNAPDGVVVNWYVGDNLNKATGKSVMISGFDLDYGDNGIRATYVNNDGDLVKSNVVFVKLKESLDVMIDTGSDAEGNPAAIFRVYYDMTDETKAAFLAKNPTFVWKAGMGNDRTLYKDIDNPENSELIEYRLEKSSVPLVGAYVRALDVDGNMIYSSFSSQLSLFDSVIKLPETIKKGEAFKAEFLSKVLVPDEKWSFRWLLDGNVIENETAGSIELTVNDGTEHELGLDVIYDVYERSLRTRFTAIGDDPVTPDPLVPKFRWNGDSPITLNDKVFIELLDMDSSASYYWKIDNREIKLNQSFTYYACSEFGYGPHSVVIGAIIDGVRHETGPMTFDIVEGVNVSFAARTPDNMNTAIATLSMKDDNPHRNSKLTYKWKFGSSDKVFETDVPEVPVPADIPQDSFYIPTELDVYDGSELLYSFNDSILLETYESGKIIEAKVPSDGTRIQQFDVAIPYVDASRISYEWKSNDGLLLEPDGSKVDISLSADKLGPHAIGVRFKLDENNWMEKWFTLNVTVEDPVSSVVFNIEVLKDASYHKFTFDNETPYILMEKDVTRNIKPGTTHKAKVEAFDSHDRLIGSWSAENISVLEGETKPINAKVAALDVFSSVNLNLTNTIEELEGDLWLTPVSYKINVKSENDTFESIVTDISKPVAVDKLYKGEAYTITVSAINSKEASIGSATVSAKAGDPAKSVEIRELTGDGKLSISVEGVASTDDVKASYGSADVPLKFADGAWKGELTATAGKGSLKVIVNGIEKTIPVRIVCNHPTKVGVSYTGADIIIRNEIVTTPEIVISVVTPYDPATRNIVLKASVAGYPDAAFTWQTTYGQVYTGSEITWTVPDWTDTSYYNISVITSCGGRNASQSYKVEIPAV